MKVDPKIGADIARTDLSKLGGNKTDRTDRVDIKAKADGQTDKVGSSSLERNSAARVDLSERAQDMKKMKALATNVPEVDEAKVAKFQKLIDEGNYKVDSEAVADRMVDEHLMFSND